MIDKRLATELRSLVRRYGLEQVDRSLREIRLSESPDDDRNGHSGFVASKPRTRKKSVKARSAPEYVAKMDHDSANWQAMAALAERFQDKSFLPTFGDILNFCQIYGIDVPASKSRASAIPRVFKFMATMEPAELQRIVDDRLFSGPARLGPIADAIRENGRAAAFRDRRHRSPAVR